MSGEIIDGRYELRFKDLWSEVKRYGASEFLQWLEQSDFFIAPASTKHHSAYAGGLVQHSLNVYDEMLRLTRAYPEVAVDRESLIIISLCHDICKANFYAHETRNRKNASGAWETYDAYTVKEKLCYGGHGSKSVFILQNYMKLKVEEAIAINCHMGGWDGNEYVTSAYEQYPLAWLLHVADEAATFIKEGENK